jgi:WD40 repeat protein/tetratricopeptide (TPR) repeat protein
MATATSAATAGPAAGQGAAASYDAFISYKRTDIAFARALEKALNAFTPPTGLAGVPQRRLRVFRDEGDLTGSEYYAAIDGYLQRSAKLIVVCSPAARASRFVDDEIRRFVGHHGGPHLVPVLLAGVPNNEATPAQAAEMAFPDALTAALEMPLAVAYKDFDPRREKVDRGRFEGSWYTLLANLCGCSRDEIEQRDRVRRRRRRNLLITVGTAVFVSLATLAGVAYWQKLQADAQRNVALRGLARYLASVAETTRPRQPQTALLLAVEAVRTTRDVDRTVTVEASTALRRALMAVGGEPVGGRGGQVRSATFSDDGRRLATVEGDGRVDLWDLARPLHPQPPLATRPASAETAERRVTALSHDGRWLVLHEPGVDGPLLWDSRRAADTATRLGPQLGPGGTVLGFSPDGRLLALADAQARVHLVAPDTPEAAARLLVGHRARRGSRGEPLGVTRHVFDPSARWLLTTAWEGGARLWDLQAADGAAQLLEGVAIHGTPRFSDDGGWFAMPLDDGFGRRPSAVGLWRLDGARWQPVDVVLPAATGPSPARDLVIVGFTGAPRQLVATQGGQVHLWNLDGATPQHRALAGRMAVLDRSGRRLAVVVPPAGAAGGSAARPDGIRLVALGGAADPAADAAAEGDIDLPEPGGSVEQLRFDDAGRRLGVVTADGRLRIGTLDGEATHWVPLRGAETAGDGIRFGADGRWVFATARWGDFGVRAWAVDGPSADPVVVDAGARAELDYRTRSGGGGGAPKGGLPHAVALDPQGRWLVVPSRRGSALLVDLADPSAAARVLAGHAKHVTAAVFGPGGAWLATADWNHGARIWQPAHPERVPVVLSAPRADRESSVSAIAASPDGRLLATGGQSGAVALWRIDAPTAAPRMLDGHRGWVSDLAFSADGTRLLSAGDDGRLALWAVDDPAAARPVWSVEAHRDAVLTARLLDGHRRVVSAGVDALVRVWTTDDTQTPPLTLRGHEEDVTSFVVDAAGRHLVSGSLDGSVRLWDLAAPQAASVELGERRSPVNAVARSADGRWIAAADGSGDIRLWNRAQPADPPQRLPIDTGDAEARRDLPWGLRFSADGRWLLAIAAGRLHRWRIDLDEQLALACRSVARNLPSEIWQAHLERVPYRLTCPAAGLHPAWLRTADELAKKGRTAQAVAMYETAVALRPDLPLEPRRRAAQLGVDAHLGYARSKVRAGETDAALALYATARAIDPARPLDPDAEVERLRKAQALEREATQKARGGDVEAATARLREAVALDPRIAVDPEREAKRIAAPIWQERGDALAREGRLDEAVALYARAVAFGIESSLEPTERAREIHADALVAAARRAGDAGDLDGATRRFAQALELKPGLAYDPVAEGRRSVAGHRARQAWAQVGTGQLAQAAADYRSSRAFDPDLRLAAWELNELCWRAGPQGLAGEVLDLCDLAVAGDAGNLRYRDSRAIARTLAGDRAGAIDDLQATVDGGDRAGMERGDLDARRRLLERLRGGARFRSFADLQAVGIRP